jgi:RNA-directed DNA polymerase
MDEWEIGVSLTTPTKLEEFQEKLYMKAKAEPTFRFYQLYDKLYRWDVLAEALRRAKANRGAAGVDGQTFEQVTEYGEERWLRELQRELQEKRYRPQPVRRVLLPKPGGGERPLGIPTLKDRVADDVLLLLAQLLLGPPPLYLHGHLTPPHGRSKVPIRPPLCRASL